MADRGEVVFNAGSHTDLVRMPYSEFERLAEPTLLYLDEVM
jgi:Ala-tRNA(Pro) deacylase